jgi:DNA invertase Pin-like site-specific DNA recombinase
VRRNIFFRKRYGPTMTDRAIGYIRVSSPAQLDGYGLEAQGRDARKCAKTHGLKLVGILRDEGISGSLEAVDRPGLAEALSMVESGDVSVLLVPRLDVLPTEVVDREEPPFTGTEEDF